MEEGGERERGRRDHPSSWKHRGEYKFRLRGIIPDLMAGRTASSYVGRVDIFYKELLLLFVFLSVKLIGEDGKGLERGG